MRNSAASPKRGRPPAKAPLTSIKVTLPQSDIDALREWYPSAAEGIRALVALERSRRAKSV